MKKETIEKIFRRYIGIYDDVVFRTTGEHISENEINAVTGATVSSTAVTNAVNAAINFFAANVQ